MDLILRGRPSKSRFTEWQVANSLPQEKLPELSNDQRVRAKLLRVPERAYRVALKAGELAREHAWKKMEHVARIIAEAAQRRGVELSAVVWDFVQYQFNFVVRVNGREYDHTIPTGIIDDVVLEKEGAEQRLKRDVDFLLGGWAE